MPSENCSIYNCTVSHRSKYKGIALFKVPSGDTEFDKRWRNQLVNIIIKDREIDAALRERIRSKILFICQRHFRVDQYRHDTRCTLVPGQLPSLNLPTKRFPPSSTLTKPRESFNNLQLNRSLLSKEVPDIVNG